MNAAHTRINGSRWWINVPPRLVRAAFIVAAALSATASGIGASLVDGATALRAVVGLPIILALVRYPFALLLSWAFVDPFIGSRVPVFNGNKLDTALTLPTILLLLTMPVRSTLSRVPAIAAWFAFLGWILLGIGVSPLDHGSFLVLWLLLLDGAAAAILTINLLSTRRRLDRLIDVLLVAPTIIALYGIYGYFTHQNILNGGPVGPSRIVSIAVSAPPLALFLSNVIPVALYRFLTAEGAKRLPAATSAIVLLIAVALTFSRGALISLAICVVVAVLLLPTWRSRIGWLGGALGLTLLGGIGVTLGHVPLFERFGSRNIVTLNGRTNLWRELLQHLDPASLVGNGLGSADNLLSHLLSAQIYGVAATSAQNLYLTTLYNNGIVGLALMLVAFTALGIGLLDGFRRASGDRKILFLMIFLVLVNTLLQQIEGNDLLTQRIDTYFWMIMALPFVCYWDAEDNLAHPPGLRAVHGDGRGSSNG